jgi:hypothetical protein
MAIQEADVQQSLVRLQHLSAAATTASEDTRRVLAAVEPGLAALRGRLRCDAAGIPDHATWLALSEAEKASVGEQLAGAKAALRSVLDDGPLDSKSFMFKAYASNLAIVFLTVVGIVATAYTVWRIFNYWGKASLKDAEELEVLRMVIMMGILGGLLHYTSSLALYIGNRRLQRSWIVYYMLMPFEGAALAPIVYLLLRVGVLSPGSGTGSINTLGMYAFAGLTGLFSKQAIEMLAQVFSVIFKKITAKDSLDKDKQQP